MARRTFTDMDEELSLRIANRTDITTVQRMRFLVDAYYSVANEFEHSELQETVEISLSMGRDSVDGNSDIWWPEMVRLIDSNSIYPDDKENIERGTKATALPSRYYWYGGTFYFNTTSSVNTSIKVWYVKKPAEPDVEAYSELDVMFDAVIVMRAAILALQTVRDFAEAAIQESQLQNYLAGKNLPLRKAKYDNRDSGVQVRRR